MICKRTITFLFILFSLSLALYSRDGKDGAAFNFKNVRVLDPLFEKLYQLNKNQNSKLNIVHIGDSHIQADMFTNVIRQALQTKFGNGGYGFTFPYSLANTNGTSYIKYTSNVEWSNRRNIYPVTDVSVGLSGIGLYSNSSDFEINIEANPLYAFNKIKLLYPTKTPCFKITLPNTDYKLVSEQVTVKAPADKKATESPKASYTIHKVSSKETLYRISQIYTVTVNKLKEINGLTSNSIRVGMELKIPGKQEPKDAELKTKVVSKVINEPVKTNAESKVILSKEKPYETEFILPVLSNQVVIVPAGNQSEYNLSGIVVENDRSGIVYHSIGVNGAKVSDYNKYPLFFEQLTSLSADLIIVSLGTNEAFGKWTVPYFQSQMQMFVDKIRKDNPKAIVLLMTPPPSLFKRRMPNTFVEGYGDVMKQIKDCVVWDLLDRLGGVKAPLENMFAPLMAKDKVHYTREGYEKQGVCFSSDFLDAYDNYVKSRIN